MSQPAEALRIRSRKTVDGEGSTRVEFSVGCPAKGDTPLDYCVRCERCTDLRVGRDATDAYIVCHTAGLDTASRDEASSVRFPDDTAATVSQVMATNVVCVDPDVGFDALMALFVDRNISGAPVVDAEGRPIGIVSKTDLLRKLVARRRDATGREDCSDVSVRDLMMPIAFCLPAGESIARAAALMAFEGVHRVPVVGARGQVVGIVSPLDVLRWLAQRYGYVVSDPHA